MGWKNNYYPEESKSFFEIADGDHRVKILNAKDEQSKKGLNMHHVTLQVEGGNMPYDYFICEGEYYNSTMTSFFDGFQLTRGNFAYNTWIGKVALAHFDHKEQEYTDKNGEQKKINKARLVYFHKHNGQQTTGSQAAQVVQQTFAQPQQPAQPQPQGFSEDIPF